MSKDNKKNLAKLKEIQIKNLEKDFFEEAH